MRYDWYGVDPEPDDLMNEAESRLRILEEAVSSMGMTTEEFVEDIKTDDDDDELVDNLLGDLVAHDEMKHFIIKQTIQNNDTV